MTDGQPQHRVMQCALIACAFFVVLNANMHCAFAQSPAPLPNPNLDLDGLVTSLVSLPDGSAVFTGWFTFINGEVRPGMAKLKADGTLDPNWSVCANGDVHAMVADGNGNIYLGGSFTGIGLDWFSCLQNTDFQPRNHLAKLKVDGTLDPSWNPTADSSVYSLALDGSGNLYAAGDFSSIGGQTRMFLARLKVVDGTADATWNPNVDVDASATEHRGVSVFAFDGMGNVYIGGAFLYVNNVARYSLAKLKPDGTLDANWNAGAEPFDIVESLVSDGVGNLMVGGYFTQMGGLARNYLAKLKPDGTVDATWNPNASSEVVSLVPDGDGGLFVGGSFTSIGGQPRSQLAKLVIADGTVDPNWNPGMGAAILEALIPDNRGHLYVAGFFTSVGGQNRQNLALLPASDKIFSNGFETN